MAQMPDHIVASHMTAHERRVYREKYERGYAPWKKDEEKRLINAFYGIVSDNPESVTLIIDAIQRISIDHGRSEGAIAHRLKKLGLIAYDGYYKTSSFLRVTRKVTRKIDRGIDEVSINIDVTHLPSVRCDDEVNISVNDFNF